MTTARWPDGWSAACTRSIWRPVRRCGGRGVMPVPACPCWRLPVGIPPRNRQTPTTESVTGPVLTVHGLGAGTVADDAVRVPCGEERRLCYVTGTPGTDLYSADTTNRMVRNRTGLDAQPADAVIVE